MAHFDLTGAEWAIIRLLLPIKRHTKCHERMIIVF